MSVSQQIPMRDLFMNHFEEDLKWSELPAQYIPYLRAIVHWWPEIEEWSRITDLLQQKRGKDITITIPDGRLVKLQFKSRRNDYGDFLIEYRHDYHFGGGQSPGWIEKESDIDYLIYCVPGKAYRIEWLSLVETWRENREEWIRDFDVTPAANPDYDTRNVAIRWEILRGAGVIIDEVKLA